MQEIWIPELLATLFLFLHVIRPFVKKLRPIEGLAWLPFLALLIIIILNPAYGLRAEILPLFIYTVVLTGAAVSQMAGNRNKFENHRHFVFAFPALVLLAAAAGTAFYFTPLLNTDLITQGVYALNVKAGTAGETAKEKEYSIRIYTDENDRQPSLRPLLIVLPPGSPDMADKVCGELRNRGFTVLCGVRSRTGLPERLRSIHAFFSGTVSSWANARGRALEEERKDDLLFLMSWIKQNPRINEKTQLFSIASPGSTFLMGYDAGGSALVLLSNSLIFGGMTGSSFTDKSLSSGIKIRGLVVIESYLWSVYREETLHVPDLSPDSGWFESVKYSFNRWFWEMKSKKITALGQIPEISIPLLFMVSDRSRGSDSYSRRYDALFKTFRAVRGPAVLVSVDGAGPLAYSDFPVRYPLFNIFFSGRIKTARDDLEIMDVSAGIIAKFAAGILTAGSEAPDSSAQDTTPSLHYPSVLSGVEVRSRNNFHW